MSLPRDERSLKDGYPCRIRIDTTTQYLEVSFEEEGEDNWVFHPRFWTMGYFGRVLAEPGWDDSDSMTIGEVYAD